jgi:hypothetical protein
VVFLIMKKEPMTVEVYLENLEEPFKSLIGRLRNIILTNFPTIKETVMHEGLWYQERFYLAKIQDHVNLGVGIKGLSNKDIELFSGTGKTMRHLKFYPGQEIDELKLVEKLKIVWNKIICDETITWHMNK